MLPENSNGLSMEIEFQDYPTHTFFVDEATKQVGGMTDGLPAMRQAVAIILGVERYRHEIYTPNAGVELFDGLIGAEYGFVISELRRRIDDAFVPDVRILGTSDWVFEQTSIDSVAATFTVNTVFGAFETEVSASYD
jgi:hypothetical protein